MNYHEPSFLTHYSVHSMEEEEVLKDTAPPLLLLLLLHNNSVAGFTCWLGWRRRRLPRGKKRGKLTCLSVRVRVCSVSKTTNMAMNP